MAKLKRAADKCGEESAHAERKLAKIRRALTKAREERDKASVKKFVRYEAKYEEKCETLERRGKTLSAKRQKLREQAKERQLQEKQKEQKQQQQKLQVQQGLKRREATSAVVLAKRQEAGWQFKKNFSGL